MRLALALILAALTVGAQQAPTAKSATPAAEASVIGVWRGHVAGPGFAVDIVLHVFQDGAKLGAIIDDLDSTGPIRSDVTFKNGKFHLQLQSVNAGYDGRLNDAADTIEGSFVFAGQQLPCTLKLDKPPTGGI